MARVLIVVFALLAAGGAGWLALTQLSGQSGGPQVVEALPTQTVLVTTMMVPRGGVLGPGNIAWREWPEDAVAPGMIDKRTSPDALETYTDWITRAELLAGEPLRLDRLSDGTAGLLSLVLAPGMRAVALSVSAETSAGGFIMPDDRVDVIHTVQDDLDNDGDDEPISLTIIRNVRVLAIDQISSQVEGETTKVGDTVTVQLTPEQVELMTTARNSGRLSLALRSVSDFGETETGNIAMLAPAPLVTKLAMAVIDPDQALPDAPLASGETSAELAAARAEPSEESEPEAGWFGSIFGEDPTPAEEPYQVQDEAAANSMRAEPLTPVPSSAPAAPPPALEPPEPIEIRVIASGVSETILLEQTQ